MLRLIAFLAIAAVLAYCGATVKLGKRTFFGHVRAIWATEEVQQLKHGVEEKAGPAVDRIKRGVKAGVKAASDEDDEDAGSGAGSAGSGARKSRTPMGPPKPRRTIDDSPSAGSP